MAFGQILGSEKFGGTRDARVGDLTKLNTLAKSTIVDAINENDEYLQIMKEVERSGDPTSLAGLHNSIFRGKCIGTSVSEEQWAQIKAGTFNDIWLGDYWTINGVNWRVADFDFVWPGRGFDWGFAYHDTGKTKLVTEHHLMITPDTCLGNSVWDSNNLSTAGYGGSTIRANLKNTYLPMCKSAFGDAHIMTFAAYCSSALSGTKYATSWAWYETQIELFARRAIYRGCLINNKYLEDPDMKSRDGILFATPVSLFALAPKLLYNGTTWWTAYHNYIHNGNDYLMPVSIGATPANGFWGSPYSAKSLGVRPWFCIYQA